jgi:hypothetical protein
MPKRIRLVHWNASEAEARVAQLRAAGFVVEYELFDGPGLSRRLRESHPDAIVIDLTRMPSHGREVGLHVRRTAALRSIPLVYAGGVSEKVDAIRARLPDAVFTSWDGIETALAKRLDAPAGDPIVPPPLFAEYAATPLSKKLGVKAGMSVAVAGAPAGFERTIGELPAGAVLRRGLRARNDLLLWFVKSRAEVEARIVEMGEAAGAGGLWVIWPKRASGVKTDLTQQVVREIGLGSGLVDYKVCSVDATWTGLRFTRRSKLE